MNISTTKVSAQQERNLEKTAKVAAKTAGITGAMTATSIACMLANAKKNPDVFITAAEMLADGCTTTLDGNMVDSLSKGYKELFSNLLEKAPKSVKKLLTPNDKTIKGASERIANVVDFAQGKKLNWKFFAKDTLKIAGKWGAAIGATYLVGKTIADHIQSKKAE